MGLMWKDWISTCESHKESLCFSVFIIYQRRKREDGLQILSSTCRQRTCDVLVTCFAELLFKWEINRLC